MHWLLSHAVEWARLLTPQERAEFLDRFDPSSRKAIERALEADHAPRSA